MFRKHERVVCICSCLLDTDDEVRDRATFYHNVLKQHDKALSSAYILNGSFPLFSFLLKFCFVLSALLSIVLFSIVLFRFVFFCFVLFFQPHVFH